MTTATAEAAAVTATERGHVKSETVFFFDELTDTAKERARDWYRQAGADDSYWSESVIEDAAQIADILGIDLRQRTVKLMGGGTRQEPTVYWSGFSSQGDGACYEGSYRYAKGAALKISQHAPEDKDLHGIADALQEAQRGAFYRLTATAKHSGHYYHSGCMEIDTERTDGAEVAEEQHSMVTQCLRDFADWIYRQLERAYEYVNSDEQVDESIRANGYEFDDNGRRA
jgi:hypothetical protein